MAQVKTTHPAHFNSHVASVYRRAQAVASSAERSIADAYDRMAKRCEEIEVALREGNYSQVAPLIERIRLAVFYITSLLETSRNDEIVNRIKAVNIFVMTRLARAARSGLPKDIEGIDSVLSKLSEIFLALDVAKTCNRQQDENGLYQQSFRNILSHDTQSRKHAIDLAIVRSSGLI
jgi:flagellin-specific chaperone FliS